jgi:hypothetical protein
MNKKYILFAGVAALVAVGAGWLFWCGEEKAVVETVTAVQAATSSEVATTTTEPEAPAPIN